jgi:hypothetical protein
VKFFEYRSKFDHYTFQYAESPGQMLVYDAHVRKTPDGWELTHAYRTPMPQSGTFDLKMVTETT